MKYKYVLVYPDKDTPDSSLGWCGEDTDETAIQLAEDLMSCNDRIGSRILVLRIEMNPCFSSTLVAEVKKPDKPLVRKFV